MSNLIQESTGFGGVVMADPLAESAIQGLQTQILILKQENTKLSANLERTIAHLEKLTNHVDRLVGVVEYLHNQPAGVDRQRFNTLCRILGLPQSGELWGDP
jgi:septal ring factor EnvC (AmiA/AmiB activator)